MGKVAEIVQYNERIMLFKQNWVFTINQKKLFAELNGQPQESNEIPGADQRRVIWSDIWSESKEHNGNAEWLEN